MTTPQIFGNMNKNKPKGICEFTMNKEAIEVSVFDHPDVAETAPRKRSSDETLQKIQLAARQCFLSSGYQETTIRDIAEAAGISPAAIYTYFENKDQLFDSLDIPQARDLHPEYERQRAEIMRVALFLFSSKGFQKTSMKNVADAAGISKATLYKYCKSKEELLAQVLQESTFNTAAKRIQTCRLGSDWRENIRSFGRDYLQITHEPERMALLRCVVSESHNFPEIGRLYYEQGFLAACKDIAAYLEQLIVQSKLVVREGFDLLTAVHTYFGSLQSYILMSSIVPPEHFHIDRETYLNMTTEVFLNRIFIDPENA